MIRKPTGYWFIKRGRFFDKVMVEIEVKEMNHNDGTFDPPYRRWRRATHADMIELGINFE